MPAMFSPRVRYGVSAILGVALIASYFTIRAGDLAVLLIGTGFALYGLAAGTLDEFALGPKGLLMKWQRDFANALPRKLAEKNIDADLAFRDYLAKRIIREHKPSSAEYVAEIVADTLKAAIASQAPAAQSKAHATYIPPKDDDPT